VEEIARMLGGVEITATTRQHAKELLGQGWARLGPGPGPGLWWG